MCCHHLCCLPTGELCGGLGTAYLSVRTLMPFSVPLQKEPQTPPNPACKGGTAVEKNNSDRLHTRMAGCPGCICPDPDLSHLAISANGL